MGRAEDLFRRLSHAGEEAIDELIADRQSEELFLDFKRSSNCGEGQRLHEDDRKNLAKAISGFGNSEGGVIIWGVDCRSGPELGDIARSKVPIANPSRFKSWIEGAVSGCTVPPHPLVRNHVIRSSDEGKGFVITYIAKSYYAPHQSLKPNLQYYIRSGADFVPTPHAVLMGLFGRRPQPFVFHMWVSSPPKLIRDSPGKDGIEFNFGIQLGSHGPGLARGLYLNVDFCLPIGGTRLWVEPDRANWTGNFAYGRLTQLVSIDAFKLAPQAFTTPLTVKIIFSPPFTTEFGYKFVFGHEGSPVRKVAEVVSSIRLQEAYNGAVKTLREGKEISSDLFMESFFGIAPQIEDPGSEYYGNLD